MYLLGYDIGSSSVKACLLDAETGETVASAVSPETELEILAARPGWAEQHPDTWWEHVVRVSRAVLAKSRVPPGEVRAIGICYQMHGLVAVDGGGEVVRPAILWCDSRAVEIGARAFRELGEEAFLRRVLNSPGNFTASKLRWVRENEPEVYRRIRTFMLPGDYVAMRMTGEAKTTESGLSEAILWDYREAGLARDLLAHYEIPESMVPEVMPCFSEQGALTARAAGELGLAPGTPVTYRSGDQMNNAWSLRVLDPGDVAATAGTSGVVYGVCGEPVWDPRSRVNTFVHVNHAPGRPRFGVLLCVNGTGILNRWLRRHLTGADGAEMGYEEMNRIAARAPAGSEGLRVLPFGNGAERTLENRNPGAAVHGLDLNHHGKAHLLRAAQEGIVFALKHGMAVMGGMGIEATVVRAGHANLFLSPLFARIFATVIGADVQLYRTDNAQGAARGAGVGAGVYADTAEAFVGLEAVRTVRPDAALTGIYAEAYEHWRRCLDASLSLCPGVGEPD